MGFFLSFLGGPSFLIIYIYSFALVLGFPIVVCLLHETARQEAKSFYMPFLCLINGVFFGLRVICWSLSEKEQQDNDNPILWWMHIFPKGWQECLVWMLLVCCQYYCFVGILDHAATHASSTNSSSSSSNNNDQALVGGWFLDLLAITLGIQYIGGLFWTPMYWCCLIYPVWGIYSIYSTLFPKQDQGNPMTTTTTTRSTTRSKEKKKKTTTTKRT